MAELLDKIRQFALLSFPVLIEGETGTGKELLAREIHSRSLRQKGPFRAVNCGALSDSLVESILFGHVKGAFTGAVKDTAGEFTLADGGTLFLDEIGDITLALQTRLLRVLQEKQFTALGSEKAQTSDFRLVAATNRSLEDEVRAGRFREDLLHRLRVIYLPVPPLRERREDIADLAVHFVKAINAEEFDRLEAFPSKSISREALSFLGAQDWPGNVRELENTIKAACAWHLEKAVLEAEDFRRLIHTRSGRRQAHADIPDLPLGAGFNLEELLERVRKHYVEKAWQAADGKKAKASRLLGMKKTQNLDHWQRKYRLS
jgi:DNA-binding NtrC family response regulator